MKKLLLAVLFAATALSATASFAYYGQDGDPVCSWPYTAKECNK